MPKTIPQWFGAFALFVLIAIVGWLGTRASACADRIEDRCSGLEVRMAASEQERKDIKERLDRIQAGVTKLVDMHTKP